MSNAGRTAAISTTQGKAISRTTQVYNDKQYGVISFVTLYDEVLNKEAYVFAHHDFSIFETFLYTLRWQKQFWHPIDAHTQFCYIYIMQTLFLPKQHDSFISPNLQWMWCDCRGYRFEFNTSGWFLNRPVRTSCTRYRYSTLAQKRRRPAKKNEVPTERILSSFVDKSMCQMEWTRATPRRHMRFQSKPTVTWCNVVRFYLQFPMMSAQLMYVYQSDRIPFSPKFEKESMIDHERQDSIGSWSCI